MKVSVVWGKVTLQANSDNHFAKIKVGFLFEKFWLHILRKWHFLEKLLYFPMF